MREAWSAKVKGSGRDWGERSEPGPRKIESVPTGFMLLNF